MIEMPDGVHLAADVYLPAGTAPYPAVLLRTPYSKEESSDIAEIFQQLGAAAVWQDMRGRFASEGVDCVFRCDGDGALKDGLDTIDWITAQWWSNGVVTTWGGSARGIVQYLLATTTPTGLSAQWIEVGAPSVYEHVFFHGGVLRQAMIEQWLTNQGSAFFLQELVDHPLLDAWWAPAHAPDQFSAVNVPAVHIGGWYDIFAQGTLDAFMGYQHLGGPGAQGTQKLIMGPWTHAIRVNTAGELTYPANAADTPAGIESLCLLWFSHYLGLSPNQALVDTVPAVQYYVMGDVTDPTAPGNTWQTANDWPVDSAPIRLYLQPDGSLLESCPPPLGGTSGYFYDPDDPCPTEGGPNLYLPPGPRDQSAIEARSDVLVFSTPVLSQPLEITGRVRARVWVSTDVPDTDLMVRLTDVYSDGRSMLVLDGARRLATRGTLDSATPLAPGETTRVEVDLWSTAIILNTGHSLRISVASANAPRFRVNPNDGSTYGMPAIGQPAQVTLYHDLTHPSHLEISAPDRDPGEVVYCQDMDGGIADATLDDSGTNDQDGTVPDGGDSGTSADGEPSVNGSPPRGCACNTPTSGNSVPLCCFCLVFLFAVRRIGKIRTAGLSCVLLAAGLVGSTALFGCTVDFDFTSTGCGNGLIEAAEACDDGNTQAGDGCDSSCLVEVGWQCFGQPSVCSGFCGNGAVTGNEACDDGNALAGDGCGSACVVEDGWQCTGEPSVCDPFCGDGVLVGRELCDSPTFLASHCAELNLGEGVLGCLPDCTYDVSSCSIQAECGNEITQYPESCDGTDLAGESCQSLGFQSGDLACLPDCSGFDLSDCAGLCGDNEINAGEICDGDDLAGQTCEGLGFSGGTLACRSDCSDFDMSSCEGGICGDGMVSAGEACDGDDLAGFTCQSFGFFGGDLACGADCLGFDTTGCAATPECGNGVAETDELCDGADLRGETCVTMGLGGGQLHCVDCLVLETSGCWVCGDGRCSVSLGETGVLCAMDCGWTAVFGGHRHTCAVKADGTAWCWGANNKGQLGDGGTASRSLPFNVPFPEAVTTMSGAQSHTCAVTVDGTAWCWGWNHYGKLGDGTFTSHYQPMTVTGLSGVVGIAAAYSHSCAVDGNDQIWCWGENDYGQLGDGTSSNSPVPVEALVSGTAVGSGHESQHTCAVKADGTAWCWGSNWKGQLGNGSTVDQMTPVNASGILGNVVAVSGGQFHTCAITDLYEVWCWGWNAYGQLGDQTNDDRLHPTRIVGLADATGISCGLWHSCIRKSDGQVWCWGMNSAGQLGDGTTNSSTVPQVVPGLSDVVALSAGGFHTCAALLDGTLWCWGENNAGQLGNGNSGGTSLVPVLVAGP